MRQHCIVHVRYDFSYKPVFITLSINDERDKYGYYQVIIFQAWRMALLIPLTVGNAKAWI